MTDRYDHAVTAAVRDQQAAMLWGAQWAWEQNRQCAPVQVHMFDGRPHPYLGYLMPPPNVAGADSRAALIRLGVGAAAYGATRVLVVWDEQRLRYLAGDRDTSRGDGLVLTDAGHSAHVVLWCPYDVYDANNEETATLTWHQRSTVDNAELPTVVTDLLHRWRHPPAMNATETLIAMDLDGYWLCAPDTQAPVRRSQPDA